METTDYRTLLKEEYQDRKVRNSRYSIRAFARDLGVSASFLCQILKTTRALSEERAQTIADRMTNWGPDKKRTFALLCRYASTQPEELKRVIFSELDSLRIQTTAETQITPDQFALISDWYHLAILELTLIADFQSDPAWIAQRLNLPQHKVREALERLERLALLDRQALPWRKTRNDFTIKDAPSEVVRRFHFQHLDHAKEAIFEQGFDERDFSGITVSVDPGKLPEAKALIRNFRRQMMHLLESGPAQSVYHMAIQLYRLDSGSERE